ncbi:Putative redox-active protein (C_GCAxxG_C_C) [Desulforamulus putei DSM 12395]|uniref:Putative redox-active protein (C_GCAxxG_C_C) n=1 Tax=Desulforamulus putei DSM 12395 TaxID=1121429 RepID=A0A1M5CQQ5_9FIRM|nr:Putative redox-active protein (C_GCAxxG_C_C) [Desulforamulus putei DSM 12395]
MFPGILATYGPELGLTREIALKMSGPFGGGVARMVETCGAVNGAFMILVILRLMMSKPKEKPIL